MKQTAKKIKPVSILVTLFYYKLKKYIKMRLLFRTLALFFRNSIPIIFFSRRFANSLGALENKKKKLEKKPAIKSLM